MAATKTVVAKRGRFAGITIYDVPETVALFNKLDAFSAALTSGPMQRTLIDMKEWACDTVHFHPGGFITHKDDSMGPAWSGYMTRDGYISLLRALSIPLHLVKTLSQTLVSSIINERLQQFSIRTLYAQVVDKDCIAHLSFVNATRIQVAEDGPIETSYTTYTLLDKLNAKYFVAGGIDSQSSVILLANPNNMDFMVEVICSDTAGMKPRATPGIVNAKDKDIPKYPPRKAIFPSKALPISLFNANHAAKTIIEYLDGGASKDLGNLKAQFEKLDTIKVKDEHRIRMLAREMLGLKLGADAIELYGSKALKEPLENLRTSQAASMLKRRMVPNFMGRLVLSSMA